MKDIVKAFGERIKTLRTERNISQEALAELVGIHRTYVGMIERGEKNPSLSKIQSFAKAFKLSLSDLLKGLDG